MNAALVTGGSQGVGKGVVEGLAEAGHSVFFTGRDAERLKVSEESATKLCGEVFGRSVDHSKDVQVEALFEEIQKKYQLKLLVNNVWGGHEKMVENERFTWIDSFWEQPLHRWDSMLTNGVRAAL